MVDWSDAKFVGSLKGKGKGSKVPDKDAMMKKQHDDKVDALLDVLAEDKAFVDTKDPFPTSPQAQPAAKARWMERHGYTQCTWDERKKLRKSLTTSLGNSSQLGGEEKTPRQASTKKRREEESDEAAKKRKKGNADRGAKWREQQAPGETRTLITPVTDAAGNMLRGKTTRSEHNGQPSEKVRCEHGRQADTCLATECTRGMDDGDLMHRYLKANTLTRLRQTVASLIACEHSRMLKYPERRETLLLRKEVIHVLRLSAEEMKATIEAIEEARWDHRVAGMNEKLLDLQRKMLGEGRSIKDEIARLNAESRLANEGRDLGHQGRRVKQDKDDADADQGETTQIDHTRPVCAYIPGQGRDPVTAVLQYFGPLNQTAMKASDNSAKGIGDFSEAEEAHKYYCDTISTLCNKLRQRVRTKLMFASSSSKRFDLEAYANFTRRLAMRMMSVHNDLKRGVRRIELDRFRGCPSLVEYEAQRLRTVEGELEHITRLLRDGDDAAIEIHVLAVVGAVDFKQVFTSIMRKGGFLDGEQLKHFELDPYASSRRWDKYQIDHIRTAPLATRDDLLAAWALWNLQALTKSQNLVKGSTAWDGGSDDGCVEDEGEAGE